MAGKDNSPVTQRAYTLRLRGVEPNDQSWREALWRTHEAVNKGTQAFGDWLLTLRGGLDHTLADTKVKAGRGKTDRDPTDEERKARRILLALSWLSVESKSGAPEEFIIASGQDAAGKRARKVIAALEEILRSRGVAETEIKGWMEDCSASLSAAIRDDAVWVNRSRAFDEAAGRFGESFKREDVWDMLECFFGSCEAYLAPAKDAGDEAAETEQSAKAKDLVQKAGQWLSRRFGTGTGADFSRLAEVYQKIADWAENIHSDMTGIDAINNLAVTLGEFGPKSKDLDGVLCLISGPGHKSATRNLLQRLAPKATVTPQDFVALRAKATEDAQKCRQKVGLKGPREYSDAILEDVQGKCGFDYLAKSGEARHTEYAVMLDHAARRVSQAHTWIKIAEAERSKFEADANKIKQFPGAAKDWLDQFCQERSGTTGALEPYRIRQRAVNGWKDVVAAWSKKECKTPEDRIAAARALQDDPEIDKFGDIQLFEALAQEDALCVWHEDGDAAKSPDPQILIAYVLATEAEFKKRRFKVPAYRHPDPFLHPVFCDFGDSRWAIEYSIHKAAHQLDRAEKKVNKMREEVEKAQKSLEQQAGQKMADAQEELEAAQKKLEKAEQDLDYLRSTRQMKMKLFNGKTIEEYLLAWQSKRLARDLAIGQSSSIRVNAVGKQSKRLEGGQVVGQGTQDKKIVVVARADRLALAASDATEPDLVKIAGLFEKKHWNGRLQAPRGQLEAIARYVEKHDWNEKAEKMRNATEWSVTFSAELQPKGPWLAYAAKHADDVSAKFFVSERGEFAVKYQDNDSRTGHARLILSRLPGLRVLSVDLGHRYAAACAVWEAVTAEEVKKECQKFGLEEPQERDLFLHLKRKVEEVKKGNPVVVEKTTVYRRIGADRLPDGTQHPAPWARLDRQFLIKLQGEKEGAREASNDEILWVHELEAQLGRKTPLIDRLVAAGWGTTEKQKARLEALKGLGWKPVERAEEMTFRPSLAVDELMSSAVRTMRLALKRHGDRARIAHYLIADTKTRPGCVAEKLDDNGRVELLQDALFLWQDLFSPSGWWKDDAAKKLWDDHVAKLPEYKAPEESSGPDHKKKQKENREKLRDAAHALAQNESLRKTLHNEWKRRWEKDDEELRKQLRCLRRWILPPREYAGNPAIRNVGGLSLTRIATLTEFRRKVQVGFFTRLKPGGERAEIKEKFEQKTLDALEHLREQRVKQLASRIVEAALGIGSEGGKGWVGGKRPRKRIEDSRFAPCHAIVIEDLTHYRPEETRTRRENRQLMTWSSSRVKKHLAEACQLHGLHLREVSASYTSRQDSRTGAPGIRCQDVPVKAFMQSPFWRKQVKLAEAKQSANKGDARARFLCELNAMWKDKTAADWKKAGTIRVPLDGGEVFVSADPNSPAAKGLQADLNAAANIGLKALTDPDWPGKWWYVPCDSGSLTPIERKVKGSAVVKPSQVLRRADQSRSGDAATEKKNTGKKSGEIVNLWRDISSSEVECGEWTGHHSYWNEVQCRVVLVLEEQLRGRTKQQNDEAGEDDIPF